ncbi:hypothetical protein ACG9YX_05965 [Acinetobacter nematophilus]
MADANFRIADGFTGLLVNLVTPVPETKKFCTWMVLDRDQAESI